MSDPGSPSALGGMSFLPIGARAPDKSVNLTYPSFKIRWLRGGLGGLLGVAVTFDVSRELFKGIR